MSREMIDDNEEIIKAQTKEFEKALRSKEEKSTFDSRFNESDSINYDQLGSFAPDDFEYGKKRNQKHIHRSVKRFVKLPALAGSKSYVPQLTLSNQKKNCHNQCKKDDSMDAETDKIDLPKLKMISKRHSMAKVG